jgi:phenylacetate-coenzyme A ligase PaaK-like adenylate-forming protein
VSLQDFPVVTRKARAENPPRFLSSLAENARGIRKPTSGTTGVATVVHFDLATFFHLKDAAYGQFAQQFLPNFDSLLPGASGVVQLSNRDSPRSVIPLLSLRGTLFHRFPIGPNAPRNPSNRLSDSAAEDESAVRAIRDLQPKFISANVAFIMRLKRLDEKLTGSNPIRPKGIIVSGGSLFDNERTELETWFDCRVLNVYSSSEGGIIAQECRLSRQMHVVQELVTIEVKTSFGPQSEGAGEILVTNRMNWAMPVIRYETHDYGELRSVSCPCGHQGQSIVDLRALEAPTFQRLDGQLVDTRLFDAIILAQPIRRFQLIQETRERFRLRYVPVAQPLSDVQFEDIKAKMCAALGELVLVSEALDAPDLFPSDRKAIRYVCRVGESRVR